MKILLTGATGYIGKKLLPVLVSQGHEVICCVRNKDRFDTKEFDSAQVSIIEVDFLDDHSLENIPGDIEAAYYLIHSMDTAEGDFEQMERISAENFPKFKEMVNSVSEDEMNEAPEQAEQPKDQETLDKKPEEGKEESKEEAPKEDMPDY